MHHRLRLRLRLRTLFYWLVIILITKFSYDYVIPVQINIKSPAFHHQNKCPACFGESLCPDLYHNELVLTNWTRYSISKLFNTKNVYFARLNGQDVVLKRLGHDSDLVALDDTICKAAKQQPGYCHPGHYIKYLTSSYRLSSSVSSVRRGSLDSSKLSSHEWTEVLSCIRTQRLVDLIFARARLHSSSTSLEHVLTLLMINPEPLLFMMFSKEEGWPFPQYLGACGRMAVFEHSGRMLTHYFRSPWRTRLSLSVQLLEMATKFASNELDVALYLTDWSADNFAVDAAGKVRLVDGENFVLVDQNAAAGPGWDTPHTTTQEGLGCQDHFCYAAEDLCTHRLSDLNLYGVCKGLLARKAFSPGLPEGLLHSIPEDVLRRQPLVPRLLDECAMPSHAGGRFEAARELLEHLKALA